MTNIKFIHGDCLTELRKMKSKSVDISFYDPPYNAKKKYDGYKDNLTEKDYFDWMNNVFLECDRVSKNGVIVFISGKLVKLFLNIFPDNSHTIIIHKRAAGVCSNNYMLQYHAIISSVTPIIKTRDLWSDIRLPGEGYFFREPRYENPGMTSLSLTERVIENFTKKKNIVLDPFSGIGTTAMACKKLNRMFIGIEQSKKYYEISKKRVG